MIRGRPLRGGKEKGMAVWGCQGKDRAPTHLRKAISHGVKITNLTSSPTGQLPTESLGEENNIELGGGKKRGGRGCSENAKGAFQK